MLVRSGIWSIVNKRGWYPVVVAETISFRKSLTLWQRFDVESRVLGSIEIADRFSIVEVPTALATRILVALRATKIRGQKVTVNRDRSQGD